MPVIFPDEAIAVIDALLFAAPRPLSAAVLSRLTGLTPDDVRGLLQELEAVYNRPEHGVKLVQVAQGYQLVTHPQLHVYVEKLHQERSREHLLSQAALETLSIIAYYQPVTKARIEAIRGVNTDHVLTMLLERGLIEEGGRGTGPGRPVLYATTNGFLEHFGLGDLRDLPELQALKRPSKSS
jgi:segregation and condensation protein B